MYAINNLNPYFSASKAQQTKIKTFDNQKTLTPDEVKDVVNKLKNPDVLQILQENHKQTTTPLYFHYYSKTDLQEAERLKPIINDPVKGKQILTALLQELNESGILNPLDKAILKPYIANSKKTLSFSGGRGNPWILKNNNPFPRDYPDDQDYNWHKFNKNFVMPLYNNWRLIITEEEKHFKKFTNDYINAYENPEKREKLQLLLIDNLSPEEIKSTINNFPQLGLDLKEILEKSEIEHKQSKKQLIINKLNEIHNFLNSPNMNTADKYLGKAAEGYNYAHGWAKILTGITTGNPTEAIIGALQMLVGGGSGTALRQEAEKQDSRARYFAHIKHYIIEGRIKLDDFAEIIYEGTGKTKRKSKVKD